MGSCWRGYCYTRLVRFIVFRYSQILVHNQSIQIGVDIQVLDLERPCLLLGRFCYTSQSDLQYSGIVRYWSIISQFRQVQIFRSQTWRGLVSCWGDIVTQGQSDSQYSDIVKYWSIISRYRQVQIFRSQIWRSLVSCWGDIVTQGQSDSQYSGIVRYWSIISRYRQVQIFRSQIWRGLVSCWGDFATQGQSGLQLDIGSQSTDIDRYTQTLDLQRIELLLKRILLHNATGICRFVVLCKFGQVTPSPKIRQSSLLN